MFHLITILPETQLHIHHATRTVYHLLKPEIALILPRCRYELCGSIPEIDYAPMSMDCWAPPRRRDVELVAFGDGGGFVRLYELEINPLVSSEL